MSWIGTRRQRVLQPFGGKRNVRAHLPVQPFRCEHPAEAIMFLPPAPRAPQEVHIAAGLHDHLDRVDDMHPLALQVADRDDKFQQVRRVGPRAWPRAGWRHVIRRLSSRSRRAAAKRFPVGGRMGSLRPPRRRLAPQPGRYRAAMELPLPRRARGLRHGSAQEPFEDIEAPFNRNRSTFVHLFVPPRGCPDASRDTLLTEVFCARCAPANQKWPETTCRSRPIRVIQLRPQEASYGASNETFVPMAGRRHSR